jgi:hypothetical protein
MAKSLQRKKPGYTKSGVAKIVSLNLKELNELIATTSKAKIKAKIQRRIWLLIARKGLPKPAVTASEVMESTVE